MWRSWSYPFEGEWLALPQMSKPRLPTSISVLNDSEQETLQQRQIAGRRGSESCQQDNPDGDVDLDFSDLDSDGEEFKRPDSRNRRIKISSFRLGRMKAPRFWAEEST